MNLESVAFMGSTISGIIGIVTGVMAAYHWYCYELAIKGSAERHFHGSRSKTMSIVEIISWAFGAVCICVRFTTTQDSYAGPIIGCFVYMFNAAYGYHRFKQRDYDDIDDWWNKMNRKIKRIAKSTTSALTPSSTATAPTPS